MFNGCKEFHNFYSRRHYRIIGKLFYEIKVDIMFEEESLYKKVTKNFVAGVSRAADLVSTSETGHGDNWWNFAIY